MHLFRNHQREEDARGARALGIASIGIGLAELAATRQVEHLLGIEDRPSHRGILRTLGVRELMHGVSLLTEKSTDEEMAASLWARVAGDALDTALLAVAGAKTHKPASFAAVAGAVLAIGALDVYYAQRVQRDVS